MTRPSSPAALITIAVPSYNQGRFLDDALKSIFDQEVPVEVFIADGGSTDGTLEVIRRWEHRLLGWRSGRDGGQAAAINEGVAKGTAPYVAWLNSDDIYLPNGLPALLQALQADPAAPAAYGQVWNTDADLNRLKRIRTERFSRSRLAARCIISQPGTLMRRAAWEAVGGVDAKLSMSMDYDLWWKLSERFGPFAYVPQDVAVNRDHEGTKTNTRRRQHYRESMALVKHYYGRIPMRWFVAWPISVGLRSLLNRQQKSV
jgi:glycosyltransferase involved in cell wall biosynthesis